MINYYTGLRRSTIAVAIGVFSSGACSESHRSTLVENAAPAVEAVLVLSNPAPSVGDVIVVSVQANSNQGTVGSYTARINYDSTALRFDGEIAISDKGLRAVNQTPGLVRLAGAATGGFVGGHLASYRFVAVAPNSARTLSLVVDEMHMITRVDAKSALTVAPNRPRSR